MVRATVREWHVDQGWGVLDSVETPDGCWVHFSAIVTPTLTQSPGVTTAEYKGLTVGEQVELEWEIPGQDGFRYTASVVRPLE